MGKVHTRVRTILNILIVPTLIVPTLCVGMPPRTLCVQAARSRLRFLRKGDAERHRMHSHAERGNDLLQEGYLGYSGGKLVVSVAGSCSRSTIGMALTARHRSSPSQY